MRDAKPAFRWVVVPNVRAWGRDRDCGRLLRVRKLPWRLADGRVTTERPFCSTFTGRLTAAAERWREVADVLAVLRALGLKVRVDRETAAAG
ncbi:MAG: hypothetical protein AAF736_09760 [Pseudomonadota bacterium]